MNAKKIGFSGITNPMSDNEMKNTRGGEANGGTTEPEAKDVDPNPKDCIEGLPCTVKWSGGTYTGKCQRHIDNETKITWVQCDKLSMP